MMKIKKNLEPRIQWLNNKTGFYAGLVNHEYGFPARSKSTVKDEDRFLRIEETSTEPKNRPRKPLCERKNAEKKTKIKSRAAIEISRKN
jgi:hypothetical protein